MRRRIVNSLITIHILYSSCNFLIIFILCNIMNSEQIFLLYFVNSNFNYYLCKQNTKNKRYDQGNYRQELS